jgi:amidase
LGELWGLTPFTAMFNTTGQPAVSIPWGFDEAHLPVGVQIAGRPADEALLIRLSAQLEQAHPWAHWRPPVC